MVEGVEHEDDLVEDGGCPDFVAVPVPQVCGRFDEVGDGLDGVGAHAALEDRMGHGVGFGASGDVGHWVDEADDPTGSEPVVLDHGENALHGVAVVEGGEARDGERSGIFFVGLM